MDSRAEVPTIVVYDGFLANEWKQLPKQVQRGLLDFLESLQKDPYDPDILKISQIDGNHIGTEFAKGYAIYWRVESIGGMNPKPIKIYVLDVRRKDT